MLVNLLLAASVSLFALWLAFVVFLVVVRPDGANFRDVAGFVPDFLRLVRRLAVDPSLSRANRIKLWALFAYLVCPIDIIPDFIPIVGWADDVIAIALVVRSVVRTSEPDLLERHWPGSPEGLSAVRSLAHSS